MQLTLFKFNLNFIQNYYSLMIFSSVLIGFVSSTIICLNFVIAWVTGSKLEVIYIFIIDMELSDSTLTLQMSRFWLIFSEIWHIPNSKSVDSKTKVSTNQHRKVLAFQNKVTGSSCQLCPKVSHPIRKCPKFLQMAQSQRFNEIKKQGLC